MKKIYISPSIEIFYDVQESILATSHDIQTVDNNNLNGGGILGQTPGINLGGDPNDPSYGWDPGDDVIISDGDLE